MTDRTYIDALDPEGASDVAVIAKGGAVQVAGQIVQGLVAFGFVALAVRTLGTGDYGLFRQVSQLLAIAAQIGLAGFNYAAMRFIAQARAKGRPGGVIPAAWTAALGALIASMLVFFALEVFATFLASVFTKGAHQLELASLIRLGAGFVPLFALTQVLRYCTQAYKTLVPSVIVGNIVQPLARLVAAAGLILAGFGVRGAVGGTLIASGIALVLGFFLFRRMLTRTERRTTRDEPPIGAMTRFALLQGGASLLGVQTLGLSVLILGAFGTDREVGLLGIALALQTPGTLFLGSIVNIWAPVVTDLHARGAMDRLQSLFRTITRWVITFSLPVFAALIVVPHLFVDLLAGSRGSGAASLVAILAAGNIFYAGTGPAGFVLSMTGRPGINFVNSVIAVALYVGLGIAVVPSHGAIGIVVVDAIVTALINSARVVEAWVLVGVHPFGPSLIKPVAATAVGVVALFLFSSVIRGGDLVDWIEVAGAGFVYLLVLKQMGLDAEERQVWIGIKRRFGALMGR